MNKFEETWWKFWVVIVIIVVLIGVVGGWSYILEKLF